MSVDITQSLLDDTQKRLTEAQRQITDLTTKAYALKAEVKELEAKLDRSKQQNRCQFQEARRLRIQLRMRSIVIPQSYYDSLSGKVEWSEYLEEAEERSLIIVLPDGEFDEKIESAVNLMLGLNSESSESEESEDSEPELPIESREEMARIYQLDINDFKTKSRCLELVVERDNEV